MASERLDIVILLNRPAMNASVIVTSPPFVLLFFVSLIGERSLATLDVPDGFRPGLENRWQQCIVLDSSLVPSGLPDVESHFSTFGK